jgi:hypothetical protein
MDIDARIYAKEQQIKLIENILNSLCVVELNDNGRAYLKKIKEQLIEKVNDLRYLKASQNNNGVRPKYRFKFGLTDSIRNPW